MPSHSNLRFPGRRVAGTAWRLAIAGLALLPLAAAAQEDKLPPPEGWLARTDHGGDGVEALQEMPPGWHVTTGPAGIFYDPETRADGDFRVESTVFLFDPKGLNEGFGVFIGGADLEGASQVYTYLLIRADGSVIVKRRDGDETSTLLNWTKHEAVVTWAARGEGAATAKNVLSVEAEGEDVIFGVNEQEVFRTARAGQHVDGVVGLRVNHGLNLHFSSLEVTDG
ncbi:MAG: hypothetical protein F4164_01830 [Gemmatimonadales bacterium]|nr:hypothetical protein [Gemmatimonadales bacterium]MYG48113.1 hypothetical protein [Gemmatimonadales bacterium]MYK00446.1 hypothetical protein [Candidatus Palauibacter ramosifaciens]